MPNGIHALVRRGTAVNKEKSYYWFKKSADSGSMNAQYEVARLLYGGEGTAIDKEMAYKYFKLAADQGHKPARILLDIAYRDRE